MCIDMCIDVFIDICMHEHAHRHMTDMCTDKAIDLIHAWMCRNAKRPRAFETSSAEHCWITSPSSAWPDIHSCYGGQMDGWVDRWMDGRTDG